jgi:hypothetical protein
MAEYEYRSGEYVQIKPHADLKTDAPADYTARLSVAKSILGAR